MDVKEINSLAEDGIMSIGVADKYLKLYVADIDWQPHIASLWNNALKKFGNDDVAKDHVKKAVACATILPLVEKTQIPDPPSNLLFWCTGWKQFNENDWFAMLVEIVKEDLEIQKKRNKVVRLGVIDPIDVSPITRQAFNWLYEKVIEDKTVDEESLQDIRKKMANLVRAYGGAAICNVFMKYKMNVDKIMNWRSGYFFEREMHKIYSLDKLVKIKKEEISKTNSNYVKNI